MTATMGEAARWTVRENETMGPVFVRWEAFPVARYGSPMRQNERQVTNPAPDAAPPGGDTA